MGRTLVETLNSRGDSVTILTRGQVDDPFGKVVNRLVCDRTDRADFRKLLRESGEWDVVVDFLAYKPVESEDAVAVLSGSVGHFVHISTGSVYAVGQRTHNGPITEEDVENPAIPRPTKAPQGWDYGMGKRGCEEVLLEAYGVHGFPETRIRIPIVQGPWDYTLRAWRYQLWLQSGHRVELLDGGRFKYTHIYSKDVVSAILKVVEKGEKAQGQAYNFAQAEPLTHREYLEEVAAHLGVEPAFFTQSSRRTGPEKRSPWHPFGFDHDIVMDTTKAKKELGWKATPIDRWLPLTLDWFDSPKNPFAPPKDPPWSDG